MALTLAELKAAHTQLQSLSSVNKPNDADWIVMRKLIDDLAIREKVVNCVWVQKKFHLLKEINRLVRLAGMPLVFKIGNPTQSGSVVVGFMETGNLQVKICGKDRKFDPISFPEYKEWQETEFAGL